ncbi:MAG: hypothetical protein WCD79_04245 [Chthoniobacteraceae bacterium]
MDPIPPSGPPEPPIKLYSRKKFALMFCAILAGAAYYVIREYYVTGSLSKITIGAAIAAVVMGTTIISVVVWYANKPEK